MSGSRVTDEAETLPLYSNLGACPALPRLVVISTTPLAALVP